MFNINHLHPMIVHFPVALIIVGFITEVVSLFFKSEKWLSKTGFYLMLLGTLSAIAAWSTGQFFTNHPDEGEILSVFHKHETGALITMLSLIIGSAFRIWLLAKSKEETSLKWIVFVFYLVGFIAVAFTGLMGGIMVFS
jgi:uncharacterized membrane protein